MNKIISLILTIVAFKTNAQVKVGSNPTTINSNANIQVESASGQQFIITSDSTKVGIGTLVPSSTLDVKGSMSVNTMLFLLPVILLIVKIITYYTMVQRILHLLCLQEHFLPATVRVEPMKLSILLTLILH